MIQIAPQIRILVAVEAIDGRKGIDAIAQLCREKLNADPFSGHLFIFRTRRGTAIRVLQYDGQGFWLATKRLSSPSSTLFVAISPQVIGRVERYLDNRRCVVSYWRELVLLELVVSVD